MKALHRTDLFGWSSFNEERNLDFHSVAWIRPGGNVLVDPLEMSEHDLNHLRALGGAAWIVLTNRDHVRAAPELAQLLGARMCGPAGEQASFPVACDRFLHDGDVVVPGMSVIAFEGSKTPGELALVVEGTTLITGDLVRGQRAGRLNLLPDPKLSDKAKAVASVKRLLALNRLESVLVGDGWPVFRGGYARIQELCRDL